MTQEEILEGNKLIAKFMGAIDETGYFQASTIGKTKVPTGRIYMNERFPSNMHLCSISELKYHSHFDWLMPVVEKIENMSDQIIAKVWISINGRECGMWSYYDPTEVLRSEISSARFKIKHSCKTKIEATWRAIVEFIKWYTAQKQKQP